MPRRPVHCPACAASRGVAIPATCPHRDPLAALRAVEPDARHGWHLIGAGVARYGWAVYTAAGAGRYLGRTAAVAIAALDAARADAARVYHAAPAARG